MMLMLAARAAHANAASTTTTSKEPRVLVAYFSMQDGNTGDVARGFAYIRLLNIFSLAPLKRFSI